MNPYSVRIDTDHQASDFTGIQSDSNQLEYMVRPPHTSLLDLLVDFGEPGDEEEEDFLRVALGSSRATTSELKKFASWVSYSHRFLREARIPRVKTSIRDIMRAIALYAFFSSDPGKHLIPKLTPWHGLTTRKDDTHMLLPIALSYYYRLPPGPLRERFIEGIKDWRSGAFEKKIANCLNKLYDEMDLADGIAPTTALKINLFMTGASPSFAAVC